MPKFIELTHVNYFGEKFRTLFNVNTILEVYGVVGKDNYRCIIIRTVNPNEELWIEESYETVYLMLEIACA